MPQFALDWIPVFQKNTALNSSDKSFTVAAGRVWEVQWVWVEYISTSTAGNRQVTIQLQDSAGDVIFQMHAGAVQNASQTRYYLFAPNAPDAQAFRNSSYLTNPVPLIILPSGFIVRVYDASAVAASADDMEVHLMVRQYGG